MANDLIQISVCSGTGCLDAGSLLVRTAFEDHVRSQGLEKTVAVNFGGCAGTCPQGPVVTVEPGGVLYHGVQPGDAAAIVGEHLKGGVLDRLRYEPPEEPSKIPSTGALPLYRHQVLRVLRNKGLIDPESMEEYIARDGYQGAAKALTQMTAEEVVATVKNSGLRGRGGAGFPTGLKWEFASKSVADQKYLLCNGDEGDPGAFMDRSVMEADPHSVVEGMIIGSRAIGATKGVIYVRAEYPLAVKRLQKAIDDATAAGLLGKNILGSGHDFELSIYLGAGAFVCGEETALMRSIEGKRGMPRPRPPFPAHKGLWDKPTVLNNVETYANVPPILLHGADWYRSLGTQKSAGTKVFALTGAIKNVGLVEVPMGIPLRTIIYEVGGGIGKKNKKFKAVQMGGPSGGCIPEHLLDTAVDFDSINATGAIMGSGGMVVMDEDNCMVSLAKFFLGFTADESCGKCPPCRVGTRVMLDLLTDITEGRGKPGDIETLIDICDDIKNTSLCGLGQTAPNPVLTTIRYFRDEYESHIHDKWCKTGICRDLASFEIDPEICTGCGVCARACPQEAIVGEKKKPHRIIQELCIQCRTCYDKCKFNSIQIKASRKLAGTAAAAEGGKH